MTLARNAGGFNLPSMTKPRKQGAAAYIDSARDRMDPTVLGERLAERDRRQGGASAASR